MPFAAPENEIIPAGGFSAPDDELIGPSIAEKAVSAISPEVTGPPAGNPSFLSRLGTATRQMFFPKNMEEVKNAINPNLGQFGVSKILEEEGKRLGAAVRGSDVSGKIAENVPGLPKAALFPMAMGSAAVDAASDSLTPSGFQQQLGAEGAGMALRAAGPALKNAAVDPARRALGFQKSQLVSQKSPFETTRKIAQANRSAKAMLEADAISPTGNVSDTIQNASKILTDGSRKMSSVMDAVDDAGKTIKVSSIDSSLIDDLKPKFDDQFKATDKILSDLKAYSKDGLSLKDADELRARWGKIGFQDKTVASTESEMYREAFKSIDKQIKQHIGTVKPELLKEYVAAKATQENAINALRGLGNKQAADLGNNIFSLPTKVLAAGQLATGDIPGALATAGISEAIRRRGLAPVARGTYGAGKALEAGARPGFLATLQAAARRSLGGDGESKPVEAKPQGKSFLASVSKRAGERLLEAAAPPVPKAEAFSKFMMGGSPEEMKEFENRIKSKVPKLVEAAKKSGISLRRILQDAMTLQGSIESLEEMVRQSKAKRNRKMVAL